MNNVILSSILTSFLTTIVLLFLFVDFLRVMLQSMVRSEVLEKMGKIEEESRGFFKKKQKKEDEKFDPIGFTELELYGKEVSSDETKRPIF